MKDDILMLLNKKKQKIYGKKSKSYFKYIELKNTCINTDLYNKEIFELYKLLNNIFGDYKNIKLFYKKYLGILKDKKNEFNSFIEFVTTTKLTPLVFLIDYPYSILISSC